MTDSNQRTLDSYEAGFNEYIQAAPNKRGEAVMKWIDASLQDLSTEAAILEIGSAYGRDAEIIEGKGFRVEKTDAAKAFVEILQQKDPSAHVLNILTDELTQQYDLITANGVFLHFNDDEIRLALTKVLKALKPNGSFAFSLKEGKGEAWQDNKGMQPRYFKYWSKDEIIDVLKEIGFTHTNAWLDTSDNSSNLWVMIIAKK